MTHSLKHIKYDAAAALPGIYPEDVETYVRTKACTGMFLAALFRTAKTWIQSRWPSVGEWKNKLWFLQTIE